MVSMKFGTFVVNGLRCAQVAEVHSGAKHFIGLYPVDDLGVIADSVRLGTIQSPKDNIAWAERLADGRLGPVLDPITLSEIEDRVVFLGMQAYFEIREMAPALIEDSAAPMPVRIPALVW